MFAVLVIYFIDAIRKKFPDDTDYDGVNMCFTCILICGLVVCIIQDIVGFFK